MTAPPRLLDSRLLGTWRSDKTRTLAEWVYTSTTTIEERDRVASWFGRLVVRYTPARMFTDLEGDTTQCSYRVVAKDPDSVAIVCRTQDRDEIRHIHFVGDKIYWVTVGRNREFFARELASSSECNGHSTASRK